MYKKHVDHTYSFIRQYYMPRKEIVIADTLSRSPMKSDKTPSTGSNNETHLRAVMVTIPASSTKIKELHADTSTPYKGSLDIQSLDGQTDNRTWSPPPKIIMHHRRPRTYGH